MAAAIPMGAVLALSAARAQQTATSSPPLAPYHAPTIALVQPSAGTSLPQDRPIVVFRFAPGDSSDPVDERSFTVSVDGKDRTALFQVAGAEAWGAIAPAEELASLTTGAHTIAARICSIRGACGDVNGSVNISSPSVPVTPAETSRKRTMMDLVLTAVRKLLGQ